MNVAIKRRPQPIVLRGQNDLEGRQIRERARGRSCQSIRRRDQEDRVWREAAGDQPTIDRWNRDNREVYLAGEGPFGQWAGEGLRRPKLNVRIVCQIFWNEQWHEAFSDRRR